MKNKNKKIVSLIIAILTSISLLLGVYIKYKNTGEIDANKITEAITTITDVVVSEETEELSIQTKEATNKNETLETKQVIKSSVKEEQKLEEEQLEADAQVEQENIAYNGDISGKGLKLLGKYQGPTYYSQADSRWANKMYSSTNNKTQTMKTSACGPTSAAMIVSSSKGAILPTTMAKLSVDNGYRTANSGTAWSFYSFVADYFDFKEYYTTNNFDSMTKYLKQTRKDGSNKYFVIASCGSGLFTSSGHYIVLVADKNGNITVYDPYVYKGKFNTASRKKANVKLNGNIAKVSEKNFKKYANYKNFWIFSNDSAIKKTNKKTTTKKTTKNVKKSTVGKTKKLKKRCIIYSKSSLKGKKYTYKKNTTVKILQNKSNKVDKVKVKITGRTGYIKNNLYK